MNSILKAPLVRGFFSFWLLVSGVCAAELVDSSQSADSVKSDSAFVEPGYVVRIETSGLLTPDGFDTLDITINGFGKGIGGFDIKIGVDSADLQILEILPGELIDSCHWEFFSPRKTTNLPTTQLPLEVWQVIGLSQTIPDSLGPVCFGFDRPAVLMRLVVRAGLHIIENPIGSLAEFTEIPFLPIFFYWEDCTDNTISTESGDTLCVSSRVFDRGSQEISDKRPLFPSRTGIPRQCINPSRTNHPQKLVDYCNGGSTRNIWRRSRGFYEPNGSVPESDSNQGTAKFVDTSATPK